MTPESALTFLVAIFIFSITPGPGVFAILGQGLTRGAASCIPLALGMSISDIVYLVLACMGLATIAEHWGGLFTVVRILGALYLFYLAWKMWTAKVNVDLEETVSTKGSAIGGFVQGFLISASNPKVILFYIAFLPSFMDLTALTTGDIVLASVLTLIGLMGGLMLIAATASGARRQFRSSTAMRRLNRFAGGIMAGAGVYLVSRS